jgi:hypothetical protein
VNHLLHVVVVTVTSRPSLQRIDREYIVEDLNAIRVSVTSNLKMSLLRAVVVSDLKTWRGSSKRASIFFGAK